MKVIRLVDLLTYELWRYEPGAGWDYGPIYSWFNVLEGCAWFGVAAWVVWRMLHHRRAIALESSYAGLFVLFGITDLIEASIVQPWLILVKGAVLGAILVVRWRLVRRHYVGWKM